MAVWPYVEQRFGAWTAPGGMAQVADVLAARLATRKVAVHTGAAARDLVLRDGRVVAVRTDAGDLDATVVVCAVDPTRLPALASYVSRNVAVSPPWTTHLGLAGASPDTAPEIVLHGNPGVVVHTGGRAPAGSVAWTVRSRVPADPVVTLSARGVDIRERVVVRVDRTPDELATACGRVPAGGAVAGRGRRYDVGWAPGPRSPVSTPPARTRHRGPACRSSACRRRWSPRRSDQHDLRRDVRRGAR